jgi:NAD(P)-dependent dehydrogenase (short-subunit alcohol dehydrogenase family)
VKVTKEKKMTRILEKKVAFVTGGGSGIGEASAKLLAAEGALVAIADMNFEGAERVASEINASGGTAKVYILDVADDSAIAAVMGAIEKERRNWWRSRTHR